MYVLYSYNIPARETKVGIPLEKEEEQSSSSSDEDDVDSLYSYQKQEGQSSPQPVTSKDTYDVRGCPSSLEYYGFELKEPSGEDMKIYERLVSI